ncbi:long-chain fatty acid--CoA ligase [Isoalcanivorax beigongshangi]|uniref:Long-chain fatty acid--CoA ligase n=1 Tax=Isoalcanivorax beigongshangi TaxID=3238810 RepID=A0ABV4AH14_9GAMM
MFDRHLAVWPAQLPRQLTLPQTCLYTNLAVSALRYPERPAVIYYDYVIDYRTLKQQVDALAGYLAAQGVARGDRVLLYMQNAPQFIISYYAILRANAVVVPVNPMNRAAELEHYLSDTGASLCLCGQELVDTIAPMIGRGDFKHLVVAAYSDYLPAQTDLTLPEEVKAPRKPLSGAGVISFSDALAQQLPPPELLVGPDDLAVMPYSSGTTGAPKGCMHTHRSVMMPCLGVALWMEGNSESVTLATLPYFHVTGMQSSMNAPIYQGSTIVLMTRWDRRVAAALIQRYRVTRWGNIVAMVIDLLSDPDLANYDLSSLNNVGGGGAAMPQAISDKLKALTGLDYIEGYGMSETMAATHVNPVHRAKPHCLGVPIFGVDARVVDVETLTELGVGDVGEIIIASPQLMQGYWNLPEETAKTFIEFEGKQFLRTGDMGYYDEEGYFFIVDRVKRMINAAGFKVWPAEVEAILYRHPAVQENCIISTPHERRGESVKACVVLAAGHEQVTAEDIIAWCKEQMAAYKVPQEVAFYDALPRSQTGKILWRTLQEQEWAPAQSS